MKVRNINSLIQTMGNNMKFCIYAIILFLSLSQTAFAAPYDITLEDQNGVRVLALSFNGNIPPAPKVDKILREALNRAVATDSSKDILAMGFHGDDVLNSNQYSGELFYNATQKKVMTADEWHGVKTTNLENANYFVEVQEQKTLEGIKPEKKWLTITMVFPKKPSREAAYGAIYTEIQKLLPRGLDLNAYVSVGNKKVKTSWKQVKDNDGAYIFAEYEVATKKLTRQGKLLKQY